MKRCLCAALLLSCGSVLAKSEGPGTYFVPAKGTANVAEKVAAKPGAVHKTVAFLGGSITEMNGFRPRVMKLLRAKLYDMKTREQNEKIANERRSQVGTGDRSERIRTYNFPQGRVSDHRIGLTLYKIDSVMNGDLDELIDALITADTAEKLKNNE